MNEFDQITADSPEKMKVKNERPLLTSSYTFDLIIDDLGLDTAEMEIQIPESHYRLDDDFKGKKLYEEYVANYFLLQAELPTLKEDVVAYGDSALEEFHIAIESNEDSMDEIISKLGEYGTFTDHDGE